ncbi:MAG TPA: HDOD domain-containing protein [Candidatus Krumholzibacteria bacterium]|nr:HDOD domain-containing protein [Candidatus Krumholzibacteria bacterium]HPD71604.1 HDOD domain-containing protein [Candidatus Krumholzibacteria bacterium]HRY41463.1 HDOD domain-containing protein [Candidatus Krumholzibacteria bacterium]
MADTEVTSRATADDLQLKNLIMTIRDLPAMPHVASKVLELSSDPDTSAVALQQVIADDQAMTARILKIANSAMYACSRRIKTLSEAIVVLGFNSIRSLVVTSAARNLYATGSARMGLKERLLWEHSIGCGFTCRLLVQKRHPALAEEAFLAGLMHDIGKLVLNLQLPERFEEIVQIVYNEGREFHETEREILGFDHARVGALLVNKWKLSPLLEDVIGLHHEPAGLTLDRPLLLYLDLANGLCRKYGIGFQEHPELDLEASVPGQLLGLVNEDFADLARRLQETLETEMEIFI